MRREREESFDDEPETSTGREGLFLLFSGGSICAAVASLVLYFMTRYSPSEGINLGVLLSLLIGGAGLLGGAASLAFAYSGGTRAFAFAAMIANGLVLTLMKMLQ